MWGALKLALGLSIYREIVHRERPLVEFICFLMISGSIHRNLPMWDRRTELNSEPPPCFGGSDPFEPVTLNDRPRHQFQLRRVHSLLEMDGFAVERIRTCDPVIYFVSEIDL